ncbi:MAG: trehalose-phosphatase [Betaproteobacteria bacterium]|nr:trehalose-phosphatase [Betaproteobacteria bacterium]MBI2960145.1 trehalose-phosphatase [Betaproteobacteria bacterium]
MPPPERDWAYFFDLDGTLIDIAESPQGVHIDRDLRRLIEELYRSAGGAVALISGRSIADIDRLFPGVQLPAAGQHGVERRDIDGRVFRHAFPSAQLERLRERIAEAAAQHSGLLLEDKGLSLALHYRRRPRLGGFAHRLLRSLQAQLGPQFCLQSGKRVVEVKPAGADKGGAIREFMREPIFRGRTPVFVGDDTTDEYGFDMVNRLGGHSVKVGPGRTVARWRLPDVRAVRQWLEQSLGRAHAEAGKGANP